MPPEDVVTSQRNTFLKKWSNIKTRAEMLEDLEDVILCVVTNIDVARLGHETIPATAVIE